MMVFPPSELVFYTSDQSLCGILVLLYMNLDIFTGGLSAIIDSLSISPEFLLNVEELLKRALCVLDGGMSKYYPVFGS